MQGPDDFYDDEFEDGFDDGLGPVPGAGAGVGAGVGAGAGVAGPATGLGAGPGQAGGLAAGGLGAGADPYGADPYGADPYGADPYAADASFDNGFEDDLYGAAPAQGIYRRDINVANAQDGTEYSDSTDDDDNDVFFDAEESLNGKNTQVYEGADTTEANSLYGRDDLYDDADADADEDEDEDEDDDEYSSIYNGEEHPDNTDPSRRQSTQQPLIFEDITDEDAVAEIMRRFVPARRVKRSWRA